MGLRRVLRFWPWFVASGVGPMAACSQSAVPPEAIGASRAPILNGSSLAGRFPYATRYYFQDDPNDPKGAGCSGVLVGTRHVVTAGHLRMLPQRRRVDHVRLQV
jgi:hypothetical protein